MDHILDKVSKVRRVLKPTFQVVAPISAVGLGLQMAYPYNWGLEELLRVTFTVGVIFGAAKLAYNGMRYAAQKIRAYFTAIEEPASHSGRTMHHLVESNPNPAVTPSYSASRSATPELAATSPQAVRRNPARIVKQRHPFSH